MLYVCQEWYLYPIYVDTDERCVAFTWVQLADEHDYSESPLNGHQFFYQRKLVIRGRQSNTVANIMDITGRHHHILGCRSKSSEYF